MLVIWVFSFFFFTALLEICRIYWSFSSFHFIPFTQMNSNPFISFLFSIHCFLHGLHYFFPSARWTAFCSCLSGFWGWELSSLIWDLSPLLVWAPAHVDFPQHGLSFSLNFRYIVFSFSFCSVYLCFLETLLATDCLELCFWVFGNSFPDLLLSVSNLIPLLSGNKLCVTSVMFNFCAGLFYGPGYVPSWYVSVKSVCVPLPLGGEYCVSANSILLVEGLKFFCVLVDFLSSHPVSCWGGVDVSNCPCIFAYSLSLVCFQFTHFAAFRAQRLVTILAFPSSESVLAPTDWLGGVGVPMCPPPTQWGKVTSSPPSPGGSPAPPDLLWVLGHLIVAWQRWEAGRLRPLLEAGAQLLLQCLAEAGQLLNYNFKVFCFDKLPLS